MTRIPSVDDSMMVHNRVKKTLEDEGHEVSTSNGGVEAMAIAREQRADRVLSNIEMLNMSGISLVGKLRRRDHYAAVSIITLTTESGGFHKNRRRTSAPLGGCSGGKEVEINLVLPGKNH